MTFENQCLEEEMTFGQPFEDSGVVNLDARQVMKEVVRQEWEQLALVIPRNPKP